MNHASRLPAALERLDPAWVVFALSLLLSLIAFETGKINPDGMLYVETARVYLDQGLDAALDVFYWPFLSILMAWFSELTGVGLEASGYLLCALMMAGACGLLTASVARMLPECAWYAGLVILALPGFNAYRDELLREYGAWLFLALSFWLLLRWKETPRVATVLAAQAALMAGALFRTEVVAFFGAFALWQLVAAPAGVRGRRVIQVSGLPLIGMAVLVALYVTGNLGSERLVADFARLGLDTFDLKSQALAASLDVFARDRASTILFFGSLAIVPLEYVDNMGVLLIPLLYAVFATDVRRTLLRSQLFACGFVMQLLVLCVFVLDQQFLSNRYVALLLVCSSPLAAYGLWHFAERFPRWRIPVVAVLTVLIVSNVWTVQAGKERFVEAGAWLAEHAEESPRVYVESGRAAYYAGWRYSSRRLPDRRSELADGVRDGEFDLAVLDVAREDPPIRPWLDSVGLKQVAAFFGPEGDAVIIAVPARTDDRGQAPSAPGHPETSNSPE
jgi:hypothetical protein